jgi:hypothetical protein
MKQTRKTDSKSWKYFFVFFYYRWEKKNTKTLKMDLAFSWAFDRLVANQRDWSVGSCRNQQAGSPFIDYEW